MAPGTGFISPPARSEIIRQQPPSKQVSPPTTPTAAPPSSTTIQPPAQQPNQPVQSTSSRKPNFESEHDRLRSFGAWPSTAPISKDKVARAGFYYLGSGLETACPFCKLEVSDWAFNDVALRKHRERSPQCPFVVRLPSSAASTNVPLEELMKRPEKRLETFARWPKSDIIDAQRLVNAGFYYLQEADKVRCAWCKGVIEQWAAGDVPFEEHARNFACCPFVLNPPEYACRGEDEVGHVNMCPTSPPGGSSSSSLASSGNQNSAFMHGVILPHSGPKHPHMVSSTSRLATFTTQRWPAAEAQVQPAELVDAGFFFLGMHDYTKCFHCDGGLCNWEAGDDPWVEHARWFPRCQFVLLNRGDAFVRDCQQRHEELLQAAAEQAAQADEEQRRAAGASGGNATEGNGGDAVQTGSHAAGAPASQDPNLPDHLRSELEAIMSSSDVQFYLEKGVPRQVIRMTLKKFMVDNQRGFRSHDEMSLVLGQVLSFGNKKQTAPADQKQDRRTPDDIPENVLCRVCMAQERGVVFLPCGHLATCPSCAASVTECVMCRAPIAGTLRTFLS